MAEKQKYPYVADYDYIVYQLVGSSPCEDCDDFRCGKCSRKNICEDQKSWKKEYDKEYKQMFEENFLIEE